MKTAGTRPTKPPTMPPPKALGEPGGAGCGARPVNGCFWPKDSFHLFVRCLLLGGLLFLRYTKSGKRKQTCQYAHEYIHLSSASQKDFKFGQICAK